MAPGRWSRIALALLVGAMLCPLAACDPSTPERWYTGNFRFLEQKSGELVDFVGELEHPRLGGYGKLSSARRARLTVLLDALFAAIDASLLDPATGDWCGVQAAAAAAGYSIRRFYDTGSQRWLVYGSDTTSFGQAYFFLNPYAKRNLVIEVPHEGFETDTGVQGAQLFKGLAARALIINREHRCSDPDPSPCSGTTTVCDDEPGAASPFRESDVAHHTANVFYLLHARYTDMDADARFVQLHGFTSSESDIAEIGDGTTSDVTPTSVANAFAGALRPLVPLPAAVHSCQELVGDPPSGLCGETNVEARYTHQPNGAECPAAASVSSGRFLHVEQGLTLRDEDDADGWSRGDVAAALLATWPACTLNGGAGDCTLGPPHTQEPALACPAVPAP